MWIQLSQRMTMATLRLRSREGQVDMKLYFYVAIRQYSAELYREE